MASLGDRETGTDRGTERVRDRQEHSPRTVASLGDREAGTDRGTERVRDRYRNTLPLQFEPSAFEIERQRDRG